MLAIRFHGRGGQGAKTASRIVATAAFLQGFQAQDSPIYGAERRGAPVTAFTRIDKEPIRERGLIARPDREAVCEAIARELTELGLAPSVIEQNQILALRCYDLMPTPAIETGPREPAPAARLRSPVYEPPTRGTAYKDASGAAVLAICVVLFSACSEFERRNVDQDRPTDTRVPVQLSASAQHEHRAVMLQHLESIQLIINALVEENYDLAKGLTESHLGFFKHREVMARQQPENFPPAYHDLAMAHHEAAEQLAGIMPTKDLKQIMPKLNDVLKACVACHHEYTVRQFS